MRRVWIAVPLFLLAAGLASERASTPPRQPGPGIPNTASKTGLLGVASCSNRSCHGGERGEAGPALRSEYSRWVTLDPHARAFDTLLGEKSAGIMGILGGKAHEDARCLACHSPPQAASDPGLAWTRAGGTGCESCHGPARDWHGQHDGEVWRKKTASEKAVAGFAPLGGPVGLARACAGCHVGAPADKKAGLPRRAVTHDLIAAGHPPLRFDLPTYLANLPPHWDEKKWPAAREADLWLADQVVSGRHAAALIADNAEGGPDFADQACYSCHRPVGTGGSRGRAVLGAWYLGVLGRAGEGLPNGKEVRSALESLRGEYAKSGGRAVTGEARELECELGKAEKGLRALDGGARDRLRKALMALPDEELARWERAAQVYHGLHALNRAEGVEGRLSGLAGRLAFERQWEGPWRGFPGVGLRDLLGR